MGSIIGFDFNVWEYKDDELVALANLLVAPFAEELDLAALSINALNESIEKHYHALPYHNFRHAIDVCQFVYELLQKKIVDEIMDPWQQFMLILASLCHDIGHNGKDNAFQIEHRTSIFEKYGSNSPMEKYHVNTTLDIFRDFDKELFSTCKVEKIPSLLQLLTDWILATDISKHDYWMEEIEKCQELNPLITGVMILKAADLSQYIRSKEVKKIWEEKICEERFLQEKEENPGIDKETFSKEFLKTQATFFQEVAKPLYDQVSSKLKTKFPS